MLKPVPVFQVLLRLSMNELNVFASATAVSEDGWSVPAYVSGSVLFWISTKRPKCEYSFPGAASEP